MAATHGSKARLFLNGWDFTGYMRSGSTPMAVDTADVSVWGLTSKKYIPSPRVEGSFNGDGVWEHKAAGLGGVDELMAVALGTASQVVTHCPAGDGFGNRCRMLGGVQGTYEITTPGDDAVAFTFEIPASGGFAARGRVLQPVQGALNIVGTANGTSLDELGAAGTTTNGAAAALQVVNKGGGAGTITVKIQHAPDGSTWADLITFGGKTVTNVAEYAEVAGTVQRWLRAIWTVTGGTWDIHVAAARK